MKSRFRVKGYNLQNSRCSQLWKSAPSGSRANVSWCLTDRAGRSRWSYQQNLGHYDWTFWWLLTISQPVGRPVGGFTAEDWRTRCADARTSINQQTFGVFGWKLTLNTCVTFVFGWLGNSIRASTDGVKDERAASFGFEEIVVMEPLAVLINRSNEKQHRQLQRHRVAETSLFDGKFWL